MSFVIISSVRKEFSCILCLENHRGTMKSKWENNMKLYFGQSSS
ncbi:hypothetical protein T03_6042 [Trichinella britovi]|uniref:Uncharacterized protein n=1 Tax=Trichinella britovi TaxID=45882 RepID=A0A0V0YU40_TRIBR|nr:hypothetical protein T03_6042 [Trichinella britovi]